MEVTLYKVKKLINDVRTPYESDSFRILPNVHLKAPTSVLAPTLEIQASLDPTEYNYVYIPSFSRYYWVNNWTYDAGLWICDLSVDVLASYKNEIESSTQYVVRSENEYVSTLTDTMYPATNELTAAVRESAGGDMWPRDLSNGRFIVGITGKGSVFDTLVTGVVNYISMDARAFWHFRSAVYDDTLSFYKKTGSFGDLPTELVKLLVDINEYIVSCIYVPYTPVGQSIDEITIGLWTWRPPEGVEVKQIAMLTEYDITRDIYLPKHPDYTEYGFYLNGAGFSSYSLSVPGVGTLALDANALMRANTVRVRLRGDAYSGAGKCTVHAVVGELETTKTFFELYDIPVNIGVPIQLAGSENSTGGLINGMINVGKSLANSDIMGAFGSAVDSVSSVPAAAGHVVGSQGTFVNLKEPLGLRAIFNMPASRDPSIFGRPCCRAIALNALGDGYCQTANAHISLRSAYRDEILQIEAFLDSGVHLFNSQGD